MVRQIINSVDVLFDINNKYVLLVKREYDPYKGVLALPGGRQEPHESLNAAITRVLLDKLGITAEIEEGLNPLIKFPKLKKEATLYQIRTYDSGTDPRGGNTTIFAIQLHVSKIDFVKGLKGEVVLAEKASLPKLAFDHAKFIEDYFKQLKPYPKTEKDYRLDAYEKPSVTVDMIIFTIKSNSLQVLLIKRKAWPFKDYWALPGGFVEMDEPLDESARRELEEETGVRDVYLEQLYTFGAPKRDPRTRVISVAYYALVSSDKIKLKASSDASDAQWFDAEKPPKLAFDHAEIINYALDRMRNKIEYTNIAFQLLPAKFTMSELQAVYEVILGKSLDKRNFWKKIKELGLLKPLNEKKLEGAHRPAQLYSFKNMS